jgi:hypothetical protein
MAKFMNKFNFKNNKLASTSLKVGKVMKKK